MPAATLLPPQAADTIRRKRFTRAEVDRMLELGMFDGQRFELIDGEPFEQNGPESSARICSS